MGGLSNKYKGLSGVEATGGGGGGGTGDVVGPSSATANALARYNLTTGKLIKNSSIIVDDSGNVTGINNLSLSGNQTFSGVGKKIIADFSNATRANRLAFQTSTLNGNTRVPILPNGTSRLAGIDCFDGTDPDNASFLQVHSDGTNNHAGLNSAKIGTGTTKDLVFQIDGVTKAKVNAADGKFNVDTLTASLLVGTDASKNLQSVTVATSSVGTDFAANYSGSTLTLSIPDAGIGIDQGLITNLAQTIDGVKTFNDELMFDNPNATLANLNGFTTTVTSATPVVLTNTSTSLQIFTGTTLQTVVMPVTSTLRQGLVYKLVNNSSQAITVNSSGGNLIATIRANTSLFLVCIGTTLTTAADWDFGFTDFASVSGDGAVILASNSTLNNPTTTGILAFSGATTSASSFHTLQTTGTMSLGGTVGTGLIAIGRSTASQQTDIQAAATASGSTKTMNIGTGGLAGSTTNIAIGSTTGTSITTLNGITKQQNYTVATLPSASASGVGAKSFVTDALSSTFGATVTGGGAVPVPVYSDGTNWKVG
jgi:hypothetical protein